MAPRSGGVRLSPGATLHICNRQRSRAVNGWFLRRIAAALLEHAACLARSPQFRCELGVVLVESAQMARLNQSFLQHPGPTDVITFDYGAPGSVRRGERPVRGDIFICLPEVVAQANRFRTSWQSELVRCLIHGVLHLHGYDDLRSPARRTMKRRENQLLRRLARRFSLDQLARD